MINKLKGQYTDHKKTTHAPAFILLIVQWKSKDVLFNILSAFYERYSTNIKYIDNYTMEH